MPPIISVENLGKRYRIRHEKQERYTTLRDVIARKAGGLAKRLRFENAEKLKTKTDLSASQNLSVSASPGGSATEDFWALKDVSFEVKQGEVVGIIGRNGAGKSTLLKILSRITEPTTGRITLRGRVASLLEVGTGFHPELTGRENIFLNGAILGMSKAEIRSKFDEIVAFAEVERFLDTPVKRYSSGMYVRLAFAVAAHLEPEILIVDEVLAVGDTQFQKKCLGKMSEVARGGRTVLFVSHSMAAVELLCQTGLLLAKGQVARSGPVHEVVRDYLTQTERLSLLPLDERADRKGSGVLRFSGVTFRDEADRETNVFGCGEPAVLDLHVRQTADRNLRSVRISVGVDNDLGHRILNLSTNLAGSDFAELPSGASIIRLRIPRMSLAPGLYGFTLYASVGGETADWLVNAGSFEVEGGRFYPSGSLPPSGPGQGCFLMQHEFEITSRTKFHANIPTHQF